jgi:hypothetical protein
VGALESFLASQRFSGLGDLIRKPNAMQAMLKMKKLDIAELERAAES